jgi:hypothetical protein
VEEVKIKLGVVVLRSASIVVDVPTKIDGMVARVTNEGYFW